jgi:hypothetical protein
MVNGEWLIVNEMLLSAIEISIKAIRYWVLAISFFIDRPE